MYRREERPCCGLRGAGGYAQDVAGRLGVERLFVAVVGKPDAILDDRGWRWAAGVPCLRVGSDAAIDRQDGEGR